MGERTVNARQLDVLKWVVAGCPDGVMTGVTHKTTAVALQGRRLVTVSKKKGVWRAEPTAAGRHFVEHGEYPAGHWQTPSAPTTRLAVPAATRVRQPKVTGLRPVDQMLADIDAAGGSLDVSDPENRYSGLVSSATRSGKVPAGKLLQIRSGRRWGEKTLELVDQPAWMTETPDPIPVPDTLTKPHPAVITLRADKTRLPFKSPTRSRALRILNALAKEATRRGQTVTCPKNDTHQHYRQQNQPGDLTVTITGHSHTLHVTEDPDTIPHEPTARELRDFEARGYPRIPKYDKVPSGRLTITISGGSPVRQSGFGDTKTIDLTTRLPVVLQELELRAAHSEERRLEAEREAIRRREQWEQVRADAAVAVIETHRAQVLTAQAATWHRTNQLTAYLDAMRQHVETLTGDELAAANEWLTWATAHTTRSNPLNRRLQMPPDPDITPDALKPHMRGLSPYGPENRYGW